MPRLRGWSLTFISLDYTPWKRSSHIKDPELVEAFLLLFATTRLFK
ncbi:MAG TPA: hypothetical protein VN239_07660 [Nitrososphaera sp.]|nr:hypothetical protein [Nitrososphaera sp.]